MAEVQIYERLFESKQEAANLVARFGAVSIPATMKETGEGKYVVTFRI